MAGQTSSEEGAAGEGRARQPALSDQVASGLLDMILANQLEAGHRLPSEREIGEQYGVSRTVVREAVRSLAAKGVVDVRMGRGPQVAAVDPATASEALGLFLHGRRFDYDRVHEVRLLLEVHVAALAATRATDLDVERIAAADARMRSAWEGGEVDAVIAEDLEFHRAIAVATNNEIYPLLLDSIRGFLVAVYRENLESGYGEQALIEHGRILECIRSREAEGARSAMAAHIEAAARNLHASRLGLYSDSAAATSSLLDSRGGAGAGE